MMMTKKKKVMSKNSLKNSCWSPTADTSTSAAQQNPVGYVTNTAFLVTHPPNKLYLFHLQIASLDPNGTGSTAGVKEKDLPMGHIV